MKPIPQIVFMLNTPQKSTLLILFLSVALSACNRDVLFLDDFTENQQDNLMELSYESEVSITKEFYGDRGDFNFSSNIPYTSRQKFDMRMGKDGTVNILTEHLKPSNEFILPVDNMEEEDEVKYEHYKNGKIYLYNKDRKLITEVEVPEIAQKYQELYSKLTTGESGQFKNVGMFFIDLNQEEVSGNNNSRFIGLENAYDDHPNYSVYRSNSVDEEGAVLINELIVHDPSNTLQYASGYNTDLEAVFRASFGYEDGKLVSLVEESIDYNGDQNAYKEISNTIFHDFQFNLNLD